jgi:hypothetical protein
VPGDVCSVLYGLQMLWGDSGSPPVENSLSVDPQSPGKGNRATHRVDSQLESLLRCVISHGPKINLFSNKCNIFVDRGRDICIMKIDDRENRG